MQLPNELNFSWGLAFSMAWALFWRWLLVGALPSLVLSEVMTATGLIESWLFVLYQLPLSFLGLVAAVYWLFHGGRFSSLRLLLMEQAHYQGLISQVEPVSAGEDGA